MAHFTTLKTPARPWRHGLWQSRVAAFALAAVLGAFPAAHAQDDSGALAQAQPQDNVAQNAVAENDQAQNELAQN